jgi:hypothetical protein
METPADGQLMVGDTAERVKAGGKAKKPAGLQMSG